MNEAGIRAWPVPLVAGLLGLFTIHLCYVIAAAHGHVPWCLPWIDSCTSISATGRQLPEKLLFKPLMMVAALLVGISLWLAARWLAARGDTAYRAQRAITACGLVATACILVYTGALGEAGNQAKLLRKLGVTLGFALSFLGELLLLWRLAALRTTQPRVVATGPYRVLFTLMVLFVLLGGSSVLLSAFYADYDQVDDAFEWTFALLLHGYLLALARLWQRDDFRLRVVTGNGPPA